MKYINLRKNYVYLLPAFQLQNLCFSESLLLEFFKALSRHSGICKIDIDYESRFINENNL